LSASATLVDSILSDSVTATHDLVNILMGGGMTASVVAVMNGPNPTNIVPHSVNTGGTLTGNFISLDPGLSGLLSTMPGFTPAFQFRIANSPAVGSTGVPVSGVTTDQWGQTRSVASPTIGALEVKAVVTQRPASVVSGTATIGGTPSPDPTVHPPAGQPTIFTLPPLPTPSLPGLPESVVSLPGIASPIGRSSSLQSTDLLWHEESEEESDDLELDDQFTSTFWLLDAADGARDVACGAPSSGDADVSAEIAAALLL
jgi:hypothetical protein